jgi:hypothetical protein
VIEVNLETKEQADFFMKLLAGAERLATLGPKAKALGCPMVQQEIERAAKSLRHEVQLQQRVLVAAWHWLSIRHRIALWCGHFGHLASRYFVGD